MSASTTAAENDIIFADDAMHEVLLELARKYKGISAEMDVKIDAVAAIIANDARVNFIAPHIKNAPKVPIYLEGEPGQGKSSLAKAAGVKFCELVGLNFIEEPQDNYVFKDNDFYYVKVNLSGAQNKSDFGGMMVRTEADADKFIKIRRKTANLGNTILDEVISRAKGIQSIMSTMSKDSITVNCLNYEQGSLEVVDVVFESKDANMRSILAANLITQLTDESKSKGIGMQSLKDESTLQDDRISYIIKSENETIKVSVFAPSVLDVQSEYASAVLPSVRFAKFKKAKFGMVNFDDVANASANIRNILLEILQEGRYSGTMDIGPAYVVLSGNKGAADGTNTMSPMSDAELTRMRKLSVLDRPEDWSKRVLQKYGDMDCLMASFIQRHGNETGIFRPDPNARGKRGETKTNGRALENALCTITQHFSAAKKANINVQNFSEKINRDIRNCAGPFVAEKYNAHFISMVTDAIPMAENLIRNGEIDVDKFEKLSNAGRDTTGKDFCFRLGAAIADSISYKVSENLNDPLALSESLENSIFNACKGWAEFSHMNESTVMTYSFSYLSQKLNNIIELTTPIDINAPTVRTLSSNTVQALSVGIARAHASGVWGSNEEAEAAQQNFIQAVAGTNLKGTRPKSKSKSKI